MTPLLPLLPRVLPGVPLDVPVGIDGEEARRRAIAELAKAKYGGRTPEWLEELQRRLDGLIEWLVRLLGGPRNPGSGEFSPGFAVVVILLLIAVAVVVWKVGLPRFRRRAARTSEQLGLDRTRSADDYRRRADELAAAGAWGDAVRERFRGVVRELEVRTIIDARPARTAFEAAGSAARLLPGSRDDLFTGAEVFSAVAYGDQPADADTYASIVGVDTRITAAANTADTAADDEPADNDTTTGAAR